MKKVKAIKMFTWKGKDGSFLVQKGEVIEVDDIAYKQLVEELNLCVLTNQKSSGSKR